MTPVTSTSGSGSGIDNSSAATTKRQKRGYLLLKLADFSKRHVAVFAVLFGAIGGVWLLNSTSAGHPTPSIYITPETQTLTPGSTFTVQIREDSGAVAVNAVAVRLNYPADLLECTNHPDGAGSGFDIDIEQQRYRNREHRWKQATCPAGQGKIIINRGSIDGISGDRLVATVTFRVKGTTGAADLTFVNGTELSNAQTSTDILGSLGATVGAHFQIGAGSTTPPPPPSTSGRPTPVVYLTPAAQSVSAGSTLTVQVHEDSGVAKVNAASIVLNYPGDMLECVGHPDGAGSAFDFDIEQQRFSNNPGLWDQYTCPRGQNKVVFNRGMIDGVDGDKLVATVNFRVKVSSGVANLTFGEGTQLTSADNSEDILGSLSSTIGGRYPIGVGDLRGDINKDGKVDSADLGILLLHWQTNDATSDIDHSGIVDVTDLSILLSGYATPPVTPSTGNFPSTPRRPSINLGSLLEQFIKGLLNSTDVMKQLNSGSDKVQFNNNNICSNIDSDEADPSSFSDLCSDGGGSDSNKSSNCNSKAGDSGDVSDLEDICDD